MGERKTVIPRDALWTPLGSGDEPFSFERLLEQPRAVFDPKAMMEIGAEKVSDPGAEEASGDF